MPLLLRSLARPDDLMESRVGRPPASLRGRVRGILGKLGPAGKRAYQLETDAAAGRLLAAALEAGSIETLITVLRDHPHSRASAIACWQIGQACLELGEPEFAAAAFGKLSDSSHAATFQPQLALASALAALASGNEPLARKATEALARSSAGATELAGIGPLTDGAEVLRRLSDLLPATEAPNHGDWVSIGGGRSGNPVRAGGVPHLWARWLAPVHVDPRDDDRLAETADWLRNKGWSQAPSLQAIAAKDLVITRNAGGVVAIDWQTGRRRWQATSGSAANESSAADPFGEVTDRVLGSQQTLKTWFDPIGGALSTDGQRVFAVERADSPARMNRLNFSFPGLRGRLAAEQGLGGNRLVAYDLATEGKIAWAVGAGRPGQLADAYFLCAPVSINRQLVVLAEVEQVVCLLLLDPATAAPLWKQPLVGVERSVRQSPVRRLVGGSIAVAGSKAVCSTGVGVVVAVDLLDRSIAWADRFPAKQGRRAVEPLPWRRRTREVWPANADDGWVENRVLVQDEAVVVASPESTELHCLELETGASRWRIERGKGAHAFALTNGVAVVAEPDALVAFDLFTGKTRWRAAWDDGAVVCGRGLATSGELLAPLSDGTLLTVNAADGTIASRERALSGGALGNLMLHRGVIVSQSATTLARYDQRNAVLAAARQAIEDNPNDVAANCLIGEGYLSEGRLGPAVASLSTACAASPDSAWARKRLRQAVTLRIELNGPSADDLALLESLVDSPDQRKRLLIGRLELMTRQTRLPEAFAIAGQLLDHPRGSTTLPVAEGHEALPLRRASRLLQAAWQEATAAEQAPMTAVLEHREGAPATRCGVEGVHAVFAGLPAVGPTRAEVARSMATAGRRLDAAYYDASTARAGYASPSRLTPSAAATDRVWALQQVAVEVQKREAEETGYRSSSRRGNATGWRRVPLIHASAPTTSVAADQITSLAVDLDAGELFGVNSVGDTVYRTTLPGAAAGLVRRIKANEQPSVWRYGPCLYLSVGEQVVALETLPGSDRDRRLWSTEGRFQAIAHPDHGRLRRPPTGDAPGAPALDPAAEAKILSAGPRGVLVRKGEALACIDGLTGEIAWLRHDLRFGEKAAATDRLVYAVTKGGEPVRLSMLDGSAVGDWTPPPGDWRAAGQGRLTTTRLGASHEIAVTDLATGKSLVQRSVDARAKLADIENWGLAAIAPDGRLLVIDRLAGRVIADTQIAVSQAPESLRVEPRGGALVVVVGYDTPRGGATTRFASLDAEAVVNGEVYCLDAETGEPRWPRPVTIVDRGWMARQPRDSPLLVFGSRRERRSSRRASVDTSLLVVDLLTGRTVHRIEEIDENRIGSYRITYAREPAPELRLIFPLTTIALRPIDSPSPPAPPATDSTESPRGQASVSSLVKQFQQAIGGAIEQPRRGAPGR
ncbi:MAG: PQQ-binding-like beta-propeller repeat protein [Planctomycetota bacterium]